MTSSKAAKAGWLAEIIGGSQGRKLVKSVQFHSIPCSKVFPPVSC
jgi:hypothetical protein